MVKAVLPLTHKVRCLAPCHLSSFSFISSSVSYIISRSSPGKYNQQNVNVDRDNIIIIDIGIERFSLRNWLTCLWEFTSWKFIGQSGQQAKDPGKGQLLQLESKGSSKAEFLLPEDLKSFSLKAFNY